MFDFTPATKPTIYFIGVTTTKSSIMKVFPLWAKALGLDDAVIKGFDLALHAPSEDYREVVSFIKNDPLSLGALVTTHKLDLFKACFDMFDYIDPYAMKLSEVSSLSKKDGKFCAHAKDPISSGLALERFVPQNFWKEHKGEVLLMGAGGSSLAMSLYLTGEKFEDNVPKAITIANRSLPRLDSAKAMLDGINEKTEMRFIHKPTPDGNDELVAKLPPYSLIVNATGLGKDAPGSPTTDGVDYPVDSLVWEINYRGELLFMEQAKRQEKEKRLHIEDGWNYFIYGWTQVIAEVFHIDIADDKLKELSEIAKL
ncbi:MAG: shikimate dehydrogenase [Lachnospiraceae bacterium]|jgi:shikimate 5-dehydrogenase|nr:shikimate dehydrogenase [Lachnospiraceae bacterium]